MILPCRHTYVPYAEAAGAPNIVIDGTPNDNTALPLSHWPRSGTPWALKADTSVEVVFNYLDSPAHHVAVAPVTNWRFYDSIYTERFMGLPQDNASGYDDNSPINHADKLKGKLLLVHGSADDNVHVQNTMQMIEALVQANKQFDSEIYPDKNHGIYGGKTRIQLYNKMTDFIRQNL